VKLIAGMPRALKSKPFHFCPGCSHGKIYGLVGEVIDDLDLLNEAVGVACVGCGELIFEYFKCDMIQVAHGRAPAAATGLKRALRDKLIFTYQGDGDLASIGTSEIVHAAARGEKITVIFVNNGIFGMTGGQMAPTTLPNAVTATTPYGRKPEHSGYPLPISEMLALMEGSSYIARVSVHSPREVSRAKEAIKKAFMSQLAGEGFSMVEVIAACPTNWKCTPLEAVDYIRTEVLGVYPLGVIKDKGRSE